MQRRKFIQAAIFGTLIAPDCTRAMFPRGAVTTQGGNWQLPTGHYVNSPQTLTIQAPYASTVASNPYGKWYTGIALSLPVVVTGGAWPYHFALTGGPSGMTIGSDLDWAQWNSSTPLGGSNASYGVISWLNPVAGTYTLTVTVTDQAGTQINVTWTFVVGTSGFIFIDSVNGSPSVPNGGTGTGTLANPFKTIDDWYSGAAGSSGSTSARKSDATYSGDFVVYRAGAYACVAIEAADSGMRMPCVNGYKPKVHIGYPGETAIFDTTDAAFIIYSDSTQGPWFANLTATGMGANGDYKWVEWDSGITDSAFYNIIIDIPVDAGATGANPSFVMSRDNPPNVSSRGFISRCTFNQTLAHDYMLGYQTQYWTFELNTLAGVNDGNGFYAKLDLNDTWTIRGNTGLSANTGRGMVELDNYNGVTNVDVCWNNYYSTGAGIYYGPDTGGTGISGIASYRNTWQISEHTVDGIPLSTLAVTDDVNQFTTDAANSHGYQTINSGSISSATYTGEECVGLNGGFVTSGGALQGTFRSNYIGTRGHEIA